MGSGTEVQSQARANNDRGGEFERLCSQFSAGGEPIEVNFRELVATVPEGRGTHLVHPYPAKLLAKIPQFFLGCSELVTRGSTLLDPFCGSGTVPFEGQLGGLNVVGADSNPLARLITTAKLTPIDVAAARQELASVLENHGASAIEMPDVVNRSHWFSNRASEGLARLRSAIINNVASERRAIFDVSFSATVRRVSYADPRLSVPVRINPERADRYGAKGDDVLRKLKRLETIDVKSVFWTVANQNLRRLAETNKLFPLRSTQINVLGDATDLKLRDATVDLVITSPPYVGAQKYIRASSLSLGWLGLTPNAALRQYEKHSIGREHLSKSEPLLDGTGLCEADEIVAAVADRNPLRARIAQRYLIEMRLALNEIARVLRPGGRLVLVVGPNLVAGLCFDTPAYLKGLAEQAGMTVELHLLDTIESRGLMTKRNRTAGMIQQESVLVFMRD
ncbi:hypothetical protein [Sphingomonas sp. DC1200-1]